MNTNTAIVGLSFLVILIVLANPFGLWTPEQFVYLAIVALAVVAVIFAGIVFRESSGDEREEALRDSAARAGYIAGILVLTAAIVATGLMDEPQNLWLIGALIAMVGARLVTRFLAD